MKTLLALSIGLVLLLGCSQNDTSNDVYQEPAPAEELPAATTVPTETSITLPWQSCEEVGREIVAQRNVTNLFEENSDYILSLDDAFPLTVNMLESHERACMLQITSREQLSAMPSWRDEPNEFSFSGVGCYNDYTWFWGGVSEERIVLQIEDCLVLLRSSPREESTDDLEVQRPDIYFRCEPWEIFDPTLDAAGRGGGFGGIDSSGSGCVRVCYVEFEGATTPPANDADLTGASFDGNNKIDLVSGSGTPSANKAHLRFSRIRLFRAYNATNDDGIFPVSGDRSVDIDGDGNDDDAANIGSIGGNTSVDNLVIRVAANQRYCQVWNTTTDREEFRSQN